ncbi:MAG TPA: hypothetical protein VNL74_12465 [Methylococcus sp.]|nr:hypothetical protein [Methylococcus sp.]
MEKQEVRIIDIQIPFVSLVVFMIKWALAAIPAALILSTLFLLLTGLLGGFVIGMVPT